MNIIGKRVNILKNNRGVVRGFLSASPQGEVSGDFLRFHPRVNSLGIRASPQGEFARILRFYSRMNVRGFAQFHLRVNMLDT